MNYLKYLFVCFGLLSLWAVSSQGLFAQDEASVTAAAPDSGEPAATAEPEVPDTLETLRGETDALWTCLAAFLVFFMQAGFAMVECGFTRAKNACNIVMKNLMDFCLGSVGYWLIGFGLMFGTAEATNQLIGTSFFVYDAETMTPEGGSISFNWAFLIFQTVFCATAATIVSGAMAERTKFSSYLVYTLVITCFIYPIFGCWAWNSLVHDGGGWLSNLGFLDFAGSTVVHSVGGWASLAGAIVVGPRLGRYVNGKAVPIPGHNIPVAALGVFVLWLGWFGFNPGSTTALSGGNFAYIAVTTNMSAACGALGAMIASWLLFKKPDVSFTLNGALAGLVGITAGCDVIPVPFAALTGLAAGVLVVFACIMFDKLKIDDPVGAISVHGVCGAFGTIAVGLFAKDVGLFTGGGVDQLVIQALGVGVGFAWAFSTSMVLFLAIKYTMGIRVSDQEQIDGLDMHEHGMNAYPPGWIGISDAGLQLAPSGKPFPIAPTSPSLVGAAT